MRAAQDQGLVSLRMRDMGHNLGFMTRHEQLTVPRICQGGTALDPTPRQARTVSTCTNSENLQVEGAARSGGLADTDVDCNITRN